MGNSCLNSHEENCFASCRSVWFLWHDDPCASVIASRVPVEWRSAFALGQRALCPSEQGGGLLPRGPCLDNECFQSNRRCTVLRPRLAKEASRCLFSWRVPGAPSLGPSLHLGPQATHAQPAGAPDGMDTDLAPSPSLLSSHPLRISHCSSLLPQEVTPLETQQGG